MSSVLLRKKINSLINFEKDYTNIRKMILSAHWRVKWIYPASNKYHPHNFHYTQREWNQTLITKVNEIVSDINKNKEFSGELTIITSTEAISIFNDLEYYDTNSNTLGKNKVILNQSLPSDCILICDSNINIPLDNNRLFGVIKIDGYKQYSDSINEYEIESDVEETFDYINLIDKKYLLIN